MMTYKSENTPDAFSTSTDQHPVCDFIGQSKGSLSELWLHRMKLPQASVVYNIIPFPEDSVKQVRGKITFNVLHFFPLDPQHLQN